MLLAGPISHTSTQYIDFVEIFNISLNQWVTGGVYDSRWSLLRALLISFESLAQYEQHLSAYNLPEANDSTLTLKQENSDVTDKLVNISTLKLGKKQTKWKPKNKKNLKQPNWTLDLKKRGMDDNMYVKDSKEIFSSATFGKRPRRSTESPTSEVICQKRLSGTAQALQKELKQA